jgi:quinol monooxygenase YgiN
MIIRQFAPWVRENEPGVLTYAGFTRPKAPDEILLFVRYKDKKAMIGHDKAPEHQDAVLVYLAISFPVY